ncbi:Fis family transcriptional regulator [Lampropedia cohaerens]
MAGCNRMTTNIEDCVRESLRQYFRDLDGMAPSNVYEMVIQRVEKPVLEEIMACAEGNQSRAAQWLGLNRNTLRKKLLQHGLLDPQA